MSHQWISSSNSFCVILQLSGGSGLVNLMAELRVQHSSQLWRAKSICELEDFCCPAIACFSLAAYNTQIMWVFAVNISKVGDIHNWWAEETLYWEAQALGSCLPFQWLCLTHTGLHYFPLTSILAPVVNFLICKGCTGWLTWALVGKLQTESDFDAKPQVMLLGQYSTGKTTFIKHLLRTSYPGRWNKMFVFCSSGP
jgi:hypothetical protein